jgi:transmembrane sensor
MIRSQARAWVIRLQGDAGPNLRRQFERWYESDPANSAAFESVRDSFQRAGLLRQSTRRWDRQLQRSSERPSAPVRYAWAAALGIVLLVPVAWLLIGHGLIVGDTNAVMLVTRTGEIRQVDLKDGSRVTLDSGTSVQIDIARDHRGANLTRGRVRFNIVPGSAPFTVHAGPSVVRSNDAIFDVTSAGAQARVDVIAGNASVSTAAPIAAVTARSGESIAATAAGVERTSAVPGGPAWTRGMLQFDGIPIEAAVAVANRYSNRKIIISDDVAQLRVTGAFRAGDTPGLAKALATAFHLSLSLDPGGNLILSNPGERQPRKKDGG